MVLWWKYFFSNSDVTVTLVLIFPDYKTFMRDHNNLAGPIIDSFKDQGLKVELNDGEVLGNTTVSLEFLDVLKKEAAFYSPNDWFFYNFMIWHYKWLIWNLILKLSCN